MGQCLNGATIMGWAAKRLGNQGMAKPQGEFPLPELIEEGR